jgi:hypothetical protein
LFKANLQGAQCGIGAQSEQRGGNRSHQGFHVVGATEAILNVDAKPASIDESGDGCDADTKHGGNAHARQDDTGSQRQFDLPQNLPIGHAHRHGRLTHAAFDAGNACHRISHKWQKR